MGSNLCGVTAGLVLEIHVALPEAGLLGVDQQVVLQDLPLLVSKVGEHRHFFVLHLKEDGQKSEISQP